MSWHQKAANLGDAQSMYELGWICFGSHDIPGRHLQNYAKAAMWFQRAADLDYAPAITQLGVMYGSDGSEGVPEDDVKAAQLYLKAAHMGDAYAMNHLGYVYSHGKGVPKDMGEAVFWWKKPLPLEDSLPQLLKHGWRASVGSSKSPKTANDGAGRIAGSSGFRVPCVIVR